MDVIEIVIEMVMELVLEGTLGAAESKRVALPLRIASAAVLIAVFGGIDFLMVFVGVKLITEDHSVIAGLVMFALAALSIGYLIWEFFKIAKKHTR